MSETNCAHTSTSEVIASELVALHKCDSCGAHLRRTEGEAFGPRPGDVAWETLDPGDVARVEAEIDNAVGLEDAASGWSP